MIWLAVGVGVGLFLAMIAFAFLVVRDRWGFRRRLRAGRRAAAALERPRQEPVIVGAAPMVQPAMVVDEPEPVESVIAEPELPVAAPQPELPVAQPVGAVAVPAAPQSEAAGKPVPAEVKPVEAAKPEVVPEPVTAPEPVAAPEAPPRVGIQAAVAAALERRRAERAALAAAGQTPIVAPPRPLPPKASPVRPAAASVRPRVAPDRPTATPAAPAEPAAAVNVEALFEKAFKTETPAEKPKDGTNSG